DPGNNSAYSIVWRLNIGSFCTELDRDNIYYSIKEDLYSDSTCFRVVANNVTIDCESNSIYFNSTAPVIVEGKNVSIKNCRFIQNSTLPAIGLLITENASGASLYNTSILLIGNGSIGNKILSGNAKLIGNSLVLSGDNSIALYLEESRENLIMNNTFELLGSSSIFIYSDLVSSKVVFTNNSYVSYQDEFRFSFYVDSSGLELSIPKSRRLPESAVIIPQNSVSEETQVNVTFKYIDKEEVPINIAAGRGKLVMVINVSTSKLLSTTDANPYVLSVKVGSLNLTEAEKTRFGLYYFNSTSRRWEAVATLCNLTSEICSGYLTQFSTYGWIIHESETKTTEREGERTVPISGTLSCTKELAKISTEPNAQIEVRFLEQPYSNSLIKRGNSDENGSFLFIADLPGRYQVFVRKEGFRDNSLILTASDECVPRITFVRRWLQCSTSSCSVHMPVMTTRMKDVVVNIRDVASIMTGILSIKDKNGISIDSYYITENEIRFPLITDSFTILSNSPVKMRQINDLQNGKVELVFSTPESARVSGFILQIEDIGNNYIKEIKYIADKEYEIFRYSIEGNKIIVDQQLYLYPNSKFILSVSQVPLRCNSNQDCPFDSICKDGTCVVIHCPCGYISNRTCVPYECCRDEDCPEGKSCISNFCIYTPPTITEEEKKYIADRLNVLLNTIRTAKEEGEDVTAAIDLIEQAKRAYEAGEFEKAKELLEQAQQIFTVERTVQPELPVMLILITVVVVLILIFAYLVISRLSKPWRPKKK
ncbi:MAG: hypothetical protein NZ903_01555, partial [Candidatus Micrarchaeota archaeon]|nr:hypothetical protein [Candidatus Micrarchaeota archaeon]